jgi:predicted aspartyl protease
MALLGYFDRSGRAMLRVSFAHKGDVVELVLEIDTGAEPAVMLDASAALRVTENLKTGHTATLADGTLRSVLAGSAKVNWLQGAKTVDVVAWGLDSATQTAPKRKGKADGLAGRKLFKDACLTIDYVNRKISVITPALAGA